MHLKSELEIKPHEHPNINEELLLEHGKRQVMGEVGEKHLVGLFEFFYDASVYDPEKPYRYQPGVRGKFYRANFHLLKHEQVQRILEIAVHYGCAQQINEILDEDIPELNIPKP